MESFGGCKEVLGVDEMIDQEISMQEKREERV